MSPERNTLMEHAYPKLKEYCRQKYRFEFQVNLIRCSLYTNTGKHQVNRYGTIAHCSRGMTVCEPSRFEESS